jgi:hypothetical protein
MNKANSSKKQEKIKSEELKKTGSRNTAKSVDHKNDEVKDEDGVLVETARKVETSARLIGEKTVEVVEKVSDQTTEIAEIVYDRVKKGVSDAYDVGSKTLNDMSKKAVKYIKKYDDTIEMKKFNHDRNMKMQELGLYFFTQYKVKSQNITELFANDETQKILNELELLNKDIVKLGRRIKRKI